MELQEHDVPAIRREIVDLLRQQLEALDSTGLTEEGLMECYYRQERVQELRNELQALSDLKQAEAGFLFQTRSVSEHESLPNAA